MTLIQLAQQTEDRIAQASAAIETLAAENAVLKQAVAALEAYKSTMEATVAQVLASGDPLQYEALAKEFLTPAEEKARLEKLARVEALRAEAAQLESEI